MRILQRQHLLVLRRYYQPSYLHVCRRSLLFVCFRRVCVTLSTASMPGLLALTCLLSGNFCGVHSTPEESLRLGILMGLALRCLTAPKWTLRPIADCSVESVPTSAWFDSCSGCTGAGCPWSSGTADLAQLCYCHIKESDAGHVANALRAQDGIRLDRPTSVFGLCLTSADGHFGDSSDVVS